MVRREAVKSIETQKLQMISALYANSAFDESEQGLNERKKRIKDIEDNFNKAIELVYNPDAHKESEIDWNNPFWQAARRAQQRRMERFRGEGRATTVAQVVEREQDEDRPKPEYDQV